MRKSLNGAPGPPTSALQTASASSATALFSIDTSDATRPAHCLLACPQSFLLLSSRWEAMNLYPYMRQATSEARAIVRSIITSSPTPLSTRDIFSAAVKVPAKSARVKNSRFITDKMALAPYPDHPIRSMAYLKHTVLPDLAAAKEIEKVHVQLDKSHAEAEQQPAPTSKSSAKQATHALSRGSRDAWLWRLKTSQPPPAKAPKPEDPLMEVAGVNEDYGHLNKRRQRARKEKIRNDLSWMKEVRKAKTEGVADAS